MPLFSAEADVDAIISRCQIGGTRLAEEETDPAHEVGAVIPDGSWKTPSTVQAQGLRGELDGRRLVRIVTFPGPGTPSGEILRPFTQGGEPRGALTSAAGVLTTTVNGESGKRLGLHLDNWDQLPCARRVESRRRLCVNLGPGPRWLLVGTVDGPSICREVSPESYANVAPHTSDVRRFVERGSVLDCVRVRVDPGEGYIAPTELLVHDGSMEGFTEPSTAAFWLGSGSESTFHSVL